MDPGARKVTEAAARWATTAPGSALWLAILFVTTRIQGIVSRRRLRRLLQERSTNLQQLQDDPARVLLTSLLWLDGRRWLPYVPVYLAVVAPAERRLGTGRWLLVGITAHVGASYFSQLVLYRAIVNGRAPKPLRKVRDVGVSYFVLGIAAAVSGQFSPRWRTAAQGGGLAVLTGNLALRPTFTELGHLSAFVIGLGFAPLAAARMRARSSADPSRSGCRSETSCQCAEPVRSRSATSPGC
jgi:hypothetical protein